MPEIYCSPHKRLYIEGSDLEKYQDLSNAFSKSSGHGLLFLDIAQYAFTEDPVFVFWKDFARFYISLFTATPDLESHDFLKNPISIEIPDEELDRLALTVPPMKGFEYCDKDAIRFLWREMEVALALEISTSGKNIADFLLPGIQAGVFLAEFVFTSRKIRSPKMSHSLFLRPTPIK